MHELALAQDVLIMIRPIIDAQIPKVLKFIELEVGKLSGVEVDTFKFALERLLRLESLEAQVFIDEIQALIRCASCMREFQPVEFAYSCPYCQSFSGSVLCGKEMRVRALEFEY